MLGQVKKSVRHVSVCLGHSSRWKGGLKFLPHNIIHFRFFRFFFFSPVKGGGFSFSDFWLVDVQTGFVTVLSLGLLSFLKLRTLARCLSRI